MGKRKSQWGEKCWSVVTWTKYSITYKSICYWMGKCMWIKDSAPKASSHIFRDKKSVPGGFLSWIKARRYLESFLGRSFCSDAIWKPIWDQKYLAHIWTVLFKTVWLLASHWTFLNYIWKVVIINTSHRVATKIQCLGSTTYSACHMIMSRKG